MGRILAIDYGRKRIGLAVTDPLQMMASPLTTIPSSSFEDFFINYNKKEKVDAFVVGYPVQMNNQPSESVRYIDPFIKKLGKNYPEKPIYLVDERFTTKMALRAMIDGGLKKKGRMNKMIVDKISASIILQSFLENRSFRKEKEKEI